MVKMTLGVAMSGQPHGDSGKQHAEQAAQEQKTLGPIQRTANARTAFPHAHPIKIRLQRQILSQTFQLDFRARQQQTIGQPATGLNHFGRFDVLHIHEQTRTQIKEGTTSIRFGNQYACHG